MIKLKKNQEQLNHDLEGILQKTFLLEQFLYGGLQPKNNTKEEGKEPLGSL